MAKHSSVQPRRPPICPYCVRPLAFGEKSRDHVIADSWYPESTPQKVQRWTLLACRKCNQELGVLEQELLVRFAFCVDPNLSGARGIAARALTAIDPNKARNPREAQKRIRFRRRILEDTRQTDHLPIDGMIPSFTPNWDLGSRTIVRIDAQALHRVVRKWTKGLHYLLTSRLIPKWEAIDVFHVTQEVEDEAFQEIEPYAAKYTRGPGVQVLQATASEGHEHETLYRFVIWEQYRVHASVSEIMNENE